MSADKQLLDSLTGFISDIKPYHTKLKGFSSELSFKDKMTLIARDTHECKVLLQDVFGKNDYGLESMARVSEGTEADRMLPIPTMILPRFSLNTFLTYQQTPLGTDPPSLSLTDIDFSGTPDAEVPYTGQHSESRQIGVTDAVPLDLPVTGVSYTANSVTNDGGTMLNGNLTITASTSTVFAAVLGVALTGVRVFIGQHDIGLLNFSSGSATVTFNYDVDLANFSFPATAGYTMSDEQAFLAYFNSKRLRLVKETGTGRYKVPFHHGSFITVDNVPKTFGTDYLVHVGRGYVQFLAGQHPTLNQKLAFNLFRSDRLLLAYTLPFQWNGYGDGGYDLNPLDTTPYDQGELTSTITDYFSIIADNSFDNGYDTVTFSSVDLLTVNQKAVLENVRVSSSVANGVEFRLTATGFFTVKVEKITDLLTTLLGYARLNEPFDNEISFTMRPRWLDYSLEEQDESYIAYDETLFDFDPYAGTPEATDFFPSVHIKTEHGKLIDPDPYQHNPVAYFTRAGRVGVVKQVPEGGLARYVFYFDSVPPRGTYIEARVEHASQYNQRAEVLALESLSIQYIEDDGSGINLIKHQ